MSDQRRGKEPGAVESLRCRMEVKATLSGAVSIVESDLSIVQVREPPNQSVAERSSKAETRLRTGALPIHAAHDTVE